MGSSPNLNITHIAEAQNNKYITANAATDALDEALCGLLAVAVPDADVTLSASQALGNMVFVCSGALSANRNLIVPANKKPYIVANATTGGYTITVKMASGTGVAIASGYNLVYCDGTNVDAIAGGGAGANFADAETPSGSVDGSNTAFGLAHTPSPASSLQLHLNGLLLSPGGVDYTLSGSSITMATAPSSGGILLAFYRY
jgi:hypothetical protein